MFREEGLMDKAIFFGVFDFVNFHVCKTLLEQGIEVKGIHVENKERIHYLEEKRFEVGRNANFHEQTLVERDEQLDSGATIVFSLYDLFMNFNEGILRNEHVTKPIIEFLKNNQNNNILVALLLPAQMAEYSNDTKAFRNLNDFFQQLRAVASKLQLIYLPTVYGPWQPNTFLFQQAILKRMNLCEDLKEIREGTMDALFVDDAVQAMLGIFERGLPGSFYLESGRKDQWQRCASFLNMDKNLGKKNKRQLVLDEEKIKRVPIKNAAPIADSLTIQTEHLQRLLNQEL